MLDALQLAGSAGEMSMAYTEQLSMRADLMEGAYEVVRTLHATCRLAIVTNGLRTVQRSRLAHSTIWDYISELIISEEVGVAKPDPGFFDAAFARLGSPAKSDVMLIGDSLSADIRGSLDYGLDTCWFNPAGEPRPAGLSITYEIAHLGELLDFLA
jgi:HAD superfamily hydrolase (TIGR01549 family)